MANGLERREFLKVVGATGAGAALTGCGTGGAERLIPYVVAPEEVVPGLATWYRTTCRECPAGCGMNVKTREGRAIKAEGNPLSPIAHGHLCARGQASLHGLYNPDRVPQALARTSDGGWDRISWDDAEQRLARTLAQRQGESWFLTHSFSGSLDRLIDDFCTAFNVRRLRYEPFAYEPVRAASRMLFGRDAVPVHSFENAEVVLTFGADIFETWVSPVDYQHGWGQGVAYRNGRRGRLISVTPHQSLTDMNADEWLPVRPGTEHLVALAMARIIADNGGDAGAGAGMLASVDVTQAASAAGVSPERIRQVATAFANNGRSIAVGPGIASTHAAATAVASAVMLLNQVAGNIGRTVHIDRAEAAGRGTGSYADVQALVQRMDAGHVGSLLVHGPNPLYELPGRAEVERALARVPLVASFSSFLDETSAHAHLLLPDHHFLESWGDYQPRTGITAIVQPVMMPVFDTKQTGDVLLSVAVRAGAQLPDAAPTFYDYVRTQWQRGPYANAGAGAAFDEWWRDVLQTGFAVDATPAAAAAPAAADGAALAQLPFGEPEISGAEDGYYLVVYPSYRFYDGRHANRPWLQELPDPVSKFCWSSWVEINPALAEELDLDTGHIVEVATDFGSVEAPVWIHPGTRRDTIAIQLGQGHTQLGRYAMDRGVNPVALLAPLADPVSGAFLYMQQRATLRPTGRWERPIQAGLNADQENREIAQHISLGDAIAKDTERGLLVALGASASGDEHLSELQEGHGPAEEGGHGHEVHPFDARVHELQASGGFAPAEIDASPQAWPPEGTQYGEYSEEHPRWGMSIDMERCTGCSACITACYAENNIGIVGPEQVAKGRILHWMRIERYFEGEGEDLHTAFLPMLCQQCGNAPCEPVCPVYAAYHTPDGLNGQIYNRCVGTRYCANNCPYKVRTYNWFSWEWPEPLNWQLNPDVTVREKGTMEKCTFCVQRIRDQQNQARIQGRAVMDGEIVPACAQTCPSEAIVFGNLKDPNARVTRVAASGRGYRVLEHINTQSAITYLKRVRLEGAEA